MPNVLRWSLGILLAIIMAFVTGMSPVTASDNQDESNWPTGCVAADSSTPGEDGYTAPAPCKIDASGTDQDQYCIPLDAFNHPTYGFGMYKVGDNAKGQACYSTKGNTSILVTTDFDSGTWNLEYGDEDLGNEAENLYGANLGKCNSDAGRWSVMVWMTNQDDDTNLPIDKMEVFSNRPSGLVPIPASAMYDIQDGETQEVAIAERPGGLPPGTWQLDFYRDDNDKQRVARVVLWVPACGDVNPPAGDHPPSQGALPKASVRQLVCSPPKVRLTLNNRASSEAVVFRVMKNGKRLKSYRLNAGTTKRVTKLAKSGSVVKVAGAGKVLATKRIKRYQQC